MNLIADVKSYSSFRLIRSALFMLMLSLISTLSFSALLDEEEGASGVAKRPAMNSGFPAPLNGGSNAGRTSSGELSAQNFNHMTTGYPLTGAHNIAECGSCHLGGVFKGTPRNCAGCHAKGKRIVATAMSSKHIITNEPCDVCHTNTVTFLGARFNHGKVELNSCKTCHNGVISTGRPATHNKGVKLSGSCGSCHRTNAWLPATTMNHSGVVPGSCSTCHNDVKPVSHASFTASTIACDSCHRYTS